MPLVSFTKCFVFVRLAGHPLRQVKLHHQVLETAHITGVPAAPFYGWMVEVSGVSKTNGPERLAWADLHEIT